MASVSSTVKHVVARTYSAQAAVASRLPTSRALQNGQTESSTLPNGVVVSSLENNSPISSIAILVKSGSRYETSANQGVSHILRLCAGLATQNYSSFGLTRKTQQLGATIFCENGREYTLYGMNTIRDNLKESFSMLSDIGIHPSFKHWEVNDQKARILNDLAIRDPTTLSFELLHKAAFRSSGLGNSLFIREDRAGKVSAAQLQEFVKNTHKSQGMAIVGLGVEHSDLVLLAKKLEIETGNGLAGSAVYSGGELRHETDAPLAYIAVAGPGASLGSADAASLAVAQSILGTGPGTRYGSNSSGKLAAAINSAGGSGIASSFNINYSDSGLFGFFLIEEANKAGEVTKALVKAVKNLKVNDAEVKQAIVKAKAALLMNNESSNSHTESIGLQSLFLHKHTSQLENAAALDKVTASSVQNALAVMLKGKPSISAYGGISKVPYLDQL